MMGIFNMLIVSRKEIIVAERFLIFSFQNFVTFHINLTPIVFICSFYVWNLILWDALGWVNLANF